MKRNRRINLRLSDQEREALVILAGRSGQGLSELTRRLIREAIEARGIPVGVIEILSKYPALFENEQNADREVHHG
jgi:hypothetical protein